MSTETAEKLFSDLEQLDFAERSKKVVSIGNRSKEDTSLLDVISTVEKDFSFSGKRIAILSCYGSRDGDRAVRLLKESTSPVLKQQALKCLLVIGTDQQLLQVLPTLSLQKLKESFHKLHKRKRFEVIDTFLKDTLKTDILRDLVVYASSAAIEELWGRVEKLNEKEGFKKKAWGFLANYHPAFTVQKLLDSPPDTLHEKLNPALPWLSHHLPEQAWDCFLKLPSHDRHRVNLDPLVRLFPDRVLEALLNIPAPQSSASIAPLQAAPTLYKQLLQQQYFAWELPKQSALLKQVKKLSSEQRLQALLDDIVPFYDLFCRLSREERGSLFQAWVAWWESQQEQLKSLSSDEDGLIQTAKPAASIRVALTTLAFKPWLDSKIPWLAPDMQYQLLQLALKYAPKFFFSLKSRSQATHLMALREEDRLSLLLQHPKLRIDSVAASLSLASQVKLYKKTVEEAREEFLSRFPAPALKQEEAVVALLKLLGGYADKDRGVSASVFDALGTDETPDTPRLTAYEASLSGLTHLLPLKDRIGFSTAVSAAVHHLSEQQRYKLLVALQLNPVNFAPAWSTIDLSRDEWAELKLAAKYVAAKEAAAADESAPATDESAPTAMDVDDVEFVAPALNQDLQGAVVSDWLRWWTDTNENVLQPLAQALSQADPKIRAGFLIPQAHAATTFAYYCWKGRLADLGKRVRGKAAGVSQDDMVKLLGSCLEHAPHLLLPDILSTDAWQLVKALDAAKLADLSCANPAVFIQSPKLVGLLPEDRQLALVQQWVKSYEVGIQAAGQVMERALPQLRMELEGKLREIMKADAMMVEGLRYLAVPVKRELYLRGFGQFVWFASWQSPEKQAKHLKYLPEPERTDCARSLMQLDPLPVPKKSHRESKRPRHVYLKAPSTQTTAAVRIQKLWERTQHFGAFLPWAELMDSEALKEKMQSADAAERIEAMKYLAKVVQTKPGHLNSFLKLLHMKRREQDPVRAAYLAGLLTIVKESISDSEDEEEQRWALSQHALSGVDAVIDDALAAKDLSSSSTSTLASLLQVLTPWHPTWGAAAWGRCLAVPGAVEVQASALVEQVKARLKKLPTLPAKEGEEYVSEVLELLASLVKALTKPTGEQPKGAIAATYLFQAFWRFVKAASGGLNERQQEKLYVGADSWMVDKRCSGWDVQKPKLVAVLQSLVKSLADNPLPSSDCSSSIVCDVWLCNVVLKHLPGLFPDVLKGLDDSMHDISRSKVLQRVKKEKKLEYLKPFLRRDKNHKFGADAAREALELIVTVHVKNPEVPALVSSLLAKDPSYILIKKVFAYVSHHHQHELTPFLTRTRLADGLYADLALTSTFWLSIHPSYVHRWSGAQQAHLANMLVEYLKAGGLSLVEAKGIMKWLMAMPACPVTAFLSLLEADSGTLPDAIRELVLGSLVADTSKEAQDALIAACNTDQCSTAVTALTSMLAAQRGWQDEAGFNAMMATLRTLPWKRVAVLKEVVRFLGRLASEQPLALRELEALTEKADLHRAGQIVLCEVLAEFLDRTEVLEFFMKTAAVEDFQVASATAVMPAGVVKGGGLADNVAKLYSTLLESSNQRLRQAAMKAWPNSKAQVPWKQGLSVVEKLMKIANDDSTIDEEADVARSCAQCWLTNATEDENNFSSK